MSRFTKYLVSILLLFLAPIAVAQESCCWSTAGMLPVPMPPGQTAYDFSGMISGAFLSPLLDPALSDCPRGVDIMSYQGTKDLNRMVDAIGKACGAQPDPKQIQIRAQQHGFDVDYLFIGTLTAANAISINGDLYGQFTLDVKLTDNCPDRSGAVVMEGQTWWDGSNTQIAGEGGISGRAGDATIHALGQSFMPLDDIIYDYERVPENCEIQPEKERVKIGETITINLQNIVDGRGRASQPWQQILVKVEEGEILNGIENGDYKRFPVGQGSVVVEYKAPDECPEEKKDTITVENSCNSCVATVVNFPPDREIAKQEIKINCGAELKINRHQVCVFPDADFYEELETTGRVPFFIEGNTIEMEGPAQLQITGSGYGDVCSISHRGWVEVTISGELVPKENGAPELNITINEMHYKGSLLIVVECPENPPVHINSPLADTLLTYDLKIPFEDGYKLETPWAQSPYCTGTNVYILHVK